MDICLFGFKTDDQAKGETFCIVAASDKKICPVITLDAFVRDPSSLSESLFNVGAQRISSIFRFVIRDAGLNNSIYTARCFYSGGATSGISNGVNPHQLMKIGR